LWLGSDHLLHVSATLGSEEYKRFYFRDIQAITIISTKRQMVLNIVLGSLLTFSFSLAMLNRLISQYSGPRPLEIAALIVFGLPMLINILIGPTCDAHLKTAVQSEELPSLSRLRRAHRVLDRIRPFITAAQGEIPREELVARLRAIAAPSRMGRPSVTSPLGLSSLPQRSPTDPEASPTEANTP
jgi:hypothetical protein